MIFIFHQTREKKINNQLAIIDFTKKKKPKTQKRNPKHKKETQNTKLIKNVKNANFVFEDLLFSDFFDYFIL
jgi:hypothetical protein